MIAGMFHQGSGLGNQLHRYVATRVLAEDKGYEWGMIGDFKGESFMKIQRGTIVPETQPTVLNLWHEKKVVEHGVDVRGYDPEINFVQDNSVIDGEFQDARYFEHRMEDVKKWLNTATLEVPNDLCCIGFRGGEYAIFPDLFLPKNYWDEGIRLMLDINPGMRFEVHTDDEMLARHHFPTLPIIHNVGLNWRCVRYSQYSIIANSSFYIFPRLLAHHDKKTSFTVAPRYWARHNTKVWALPQNYYRQFQYI